MTVSQLTDTELWEELSRRCTSTGAYNFGVNLLDVLVRMAPEARSEFLRSVVDRAVAAEIGVRTRDGVDFAGLALRAFPEDDAAKLQALDEFLQLNDEIPELTVVEFFTDVVGLPAQVELPAEVPMIVEATPAITADGEHVVSLLPADVARIDGWLSGKIPQPAGDYSPLFELQVPIGSGNWMIIVLSSGERGPWVEAYVQDAAGMERATFPPRNEFFGEYATTVNGKPVKVTVLRA